jgi:hypothetical protein
MAAPREADAHVVAAAIACAISECGEVVVDLLRQNQNFVSKLKAQPGVLALSPFSSLFRMCKLQILNGQRDSDPVSGRHL